MSTSHTKTEFWFQQTIHYDGPDGVDTERPKSRVIVGSPFDDIHPKARELYEKAKTEGLKSPRIVVRATLT